MCNLNKRLYVLTLILLISQSFCFGQSIFREKGKYGIKDSKGNIIVPAKYEDIEKKFAISVDYINDSQSNQRDISLFFYEDGSEYKGVFDEYGKEILKSDRFKDISLWGLEYIIAELNGRKGLFDTRGKSILPIEFDSIELIKQKYIYVKQNNICGVLNLTGKSLIPLSHGYTEIDTDILGRNRFIEIKKGAYSGLYDTSKSEEVIKPDTYTNLKYIKDHYYYANIGARKVSLIKDGKVIFSGDGSWIANKESYFEVYHVPMWGSKSYNINLEGEIIDYVNFTPYTIKLENGFSYVSNKDRYWGVVDKAGNEVIPIKFDRIQQLLHYENGFIVCDGIYKSLYDLSGNIIIPSNKYKEIRCSQRGYFTVTTLDNKRGIIDFKGNEIAEPIYDDIDDEIYNKDIIYVKSNGNTGIVNKNVGTISPAIFSYIKYRYHYKNLGNCFEVDLKGSKGIVTINGKIIVPTEFSKLSIHDPEHYNTKIGYIET